MQSEEWDVRRWGGKIEEKNEKRSWDEQYITARKTLVSTTSRVRGWKNVRDEPARRPGYCAKTV